MLTDKQREILTRPINQNRVMHSQGQSHLPAFDVTAHLTRIFGFEGWDKEILKLELVDATHGHPTKTDKTGWYVTYRCLMRLTIRDPHGNVVKVVEDGATGTASNMADLGDAHDFAYKNAISYAIKRCAKDLGDQFGLSLYNKGSTARLIASSVAYGGPEQTDVPTPQSLGNDERVDADTGEMEQEATLARDAAGLATQQQIAKLHASLPRGADAHLFCGQVLMMQVDSLKLLTKEQISKCIEKAVDGR